MNKKAPIIKKRRGRKDDASLHKFVEQVRRRRESLGLPPPEQDIFDPDAAIAEWRHEQALLESSILPSKARRGIKDDSSLHELEREIRREREARGLPPEERSFNPKKIIAEWHREHGLTPSSSRRFRKKTLPQKDKHLVREFTIVIKQEPENGYWAYCPAVNGKRLYGETMTEAWEKMAAYLGHRLEKLVAKGKPLPKRNARMKK